MTRRAKRGFGHESQDKKVSVEWYTPAWVFDALGLTFDLDPCAPAGGVPWVPARFHYTKDDDGLVIPWFGTVWLNPPYGGLTEKFLAKMHLHRDGLALVFARTDTKWFHRYAAAADAILFIEKRIAFVDGDASSEQSGTGAGSMLIAWGPKAVAAARRFHAERGGAFWQIKA